MLAQRKASLRCWYYSDILQTVYEPWLLTSAFQRDFLYLPLLGLFRTSLCPHCMTISAARLMAWLFAWLRSQGKGRASMIIWVWGQNCDCLRITKPMRRQVVSKLQFSLPLQNHWSWWSQLAQNDRVLCWFKALPSGL